jgi:hypothetical protein
MRYRQSSCCRCSVVVDWNLQSQQQMSAPLFIQLLRPKLAAQPTSAANSTTKTSEVFMVLPRSCSIVLIRVSGLSKPAVLP